ncbi:hypothetical protein LTR08_005191 [Meristemomyces frigidus]|nr:hypothetical protein LTR08_005191 [Meristemomyces frigidus]
MAYLVDPHSDIQSWGFDIGDDLDLSSVLFAVEQTSHTILAYHVYMMCKHTPIRDLLAVAGESWYIAEKLGTQTDYTAAQILAREWAQGCTDPVHGTAPASHLWPVERALHHARRIVEIHRNHPRTGLLFQEWGVYLAAVVFWARAYVIDSEPCRKPRLSIPSPTEPKLSTQELDQAVSAVVNSETATVSLKEARSVIVWVKADIEKVNPPHSCGLTNSAFDVLSKLSTRGDEEGWFGA